jgi:hypothetical protein
MGILFVVALVLAWPTYGLSLVGWLVLTIFKAKSKAGKVERRHEFVSMIEPLFQNQHGSFFVALDIPKLHEFEFSQADAHQCGRHIMNYFAQNPEDAALFIRGLDRWKTKGGQVLCDPITAAKCEITCGKKSEIHLASYRAIEALMVNNKGLKCFQPVNYGKLVEYRMMTELGMPTGASI